MPTEIILGGLPYLAFPRENEEIRRCFGASYIGKCRVWVVPAYNPFLPLVEHDLQVTELINDDNCGIINHYRPPSNLRELLAKPVVPSFSHQQASLLYALSNMCAALFLDCGLGKSKIVIDYLRTLNQTKIYPWDKKVHALILAPKAVQYNWEDQFRQHSLPGELKVSVVDGTLKNKRKILSEDADVYIATHKSVQSKDLFCLFRERGFNQVIVDESQALKGYKSKTTKLTISLGLNVPRKLILSGTPMLGVPTHLYGQLKFLSAHGMEENWFLFRKKFMKFKEIRGNRRIPVGVKNLDILRQRVSRISIEYSAETELDIPELQVIDRTYKLAKEQQDAYNELVSASEEDLAELLSTSRVVVFASRVMKLQQILSGFVLKSNKDPAICDKCEHLATCVEDNIQPYTKKCPVRSISPDPTCVRFTTNSKLYALRDLIESITLNGSKIIVWARFIQELDDIEELLHTMKIDCVRVDGRISAKKAAKRNRIFNDNPKCLVYIGQISCGIGINLIAARYSVYYSLDFDLGHYIQSLKRFHRLGQTKRTIAYRLVAKDSIEEYIVQLLGQKKHLSDAVSLSIPCALCKEKFSCAERGIKLFDTDCIYKSSANKRKYPLTPVQTTQEEERANSQGDKKSEDNSGFKGFEV